MLGVRVAANVGQGLLNDVKYLDLALGRKAQVRRAVLEFERDTGPVEEAVAGFRERMEQSLRVHPAAEIRDQLTQPALRVAERVVDSPQNLCAFSSSAPRMASRSRLMRMRM